MTFKKGEPSPFKGIPKSQWNRKSPQVTDAVIPTPSASVATGASPAPVAPQAAPRNLFSGDVKKLEVFGRNGSNTDPIPGYRLYWFLDRDNSGTRLHQAKMSGWEFVQRDEVSINDVSAIQGNTDLGSQVRVFGGSFNQQPIYHYLMKKPQWLDQQHQAEREAYHDKIEGLLRKGKYNAKAEDKQYTAEEMPGSALPPISITHTRR